MHFHTWFLRGSSWAVPLRAGENPYDNHTTRRGLTGQQRCLVNDILIYQPPRKLFALFCAQMPKFHWEFKPQKYHDGVLNKNIMNQPRKILFAQFCAHPGMYVTKIVTR